MRSLASRHTSPVRAFPGASDGLQCHDAACRLLRWVKVAKRLGRAYGILKDILAKITFLNASNNKADYKRPKSCIASTTMPVPMAISRISAAART